MYPADRPLPTTACIKRSEACAGAPSCSRWGARPGPSGDHQCDEALGAHLVDLVGCLLDRERQGALLSWQILELPLHSRLVKHPICGGHRRQEVLEQERSTYREKRHAHLEGS
eukprot:CAMPEP_0204242652 /NCGR_PEP_ID=MMETSP0361-20130328/96012_1 /ASSEMBLY_ACC=CAM_ASM_000343 /TAXON_ID=268821 /ORGANISM="Scrippsiella Hangoei, Strain SHTV-5" /LENGTH=112 /DNA_ID=CAMNT_0051215493 /DNA_START=197 /DNA_END=535 /DNA_ORIENTATION=+